MKVIVKDFGQNRIQVARRIQNILEQEGYYIDIPGAIQLWNDFCEDAAGDWVYPESDLSDKDIFKKIRNFMEIE